MNHATRVEVAKSKHAAVGAAGIVWEDGLERGVPLRGRTPLFPSKT